MSTETQPLAGINDVFARLRKDAVHHDPSLCSHARIA